MEIVQVSIHNFRSIIDESFHLGSYSLLIGANNAGKSNVIDAVRVFYEKDIKYDHERDFPLDGALDDQSWIEIEFQLSEDEADGLKTEYLRANNRLLVRKYLRNGPNGKIGIFGYVGEELSQDYFYGAKGVQQGKLGDVIYIPAVSRLDDQTKLSGPSPLRDLLNVILKDLVQSSTAFGKLKEDFENFARDVKEETTSDERSIEGLEQEINQEIEEWGVEFELDIGAPSETEILKNLIGYHVQDMTLKKSVNASQQGQGFQRHLIFTLIRLSAKHQPTTAASQSSKKDFTPKMVLLLFEEPEAFLHPPQQQILSRDIKKIVEHEGHQVLLSSHSPHFVSHNASDIPSIIRLCKEDTCTTVGQTTHDLLEEVFASNQEINEILENSNYRATTEDLALDMEAIKYFLWLDAQRCGMFFARRVLLVEGPTERMLFNFLIDNGRLSVPKGGVFILDCIGKFNIHRFMNLLGALRTSHSVLLDGDCRREPHDKIIDLIERSRNSYTHKIEAFPVDLEDFLGIEKATQKHRKPQHVMFRLQKGEVDDEIMTNLIEMINDLIN